MFSRYVVVSDRLAYEMKRWKLLLGGAAAALGAAIVIANSPLIV